MVNISECSSTLYVRLQHVVLPTNIIFKQLFLQTQMSIPYINTHTHRTSYFMSSLTFLGPAKRWKPIAAARQKPEIVVVLHHQSERAVVLSM